MSRDIQIQNSAVENRSDLVGSINADVARCVPVAHLHLGKRPRFGLRGKHGVWSGTGTSTRRYASAATASMGMQRLPMAPVAEPAAAEEPPAALWAAFVLSRTLCS